MIRVDKYKHKERGTDPKKLYYIEQDGTILSLTESELQKIACDLNTLGLLHVVGRSEQLNTDLENEVFNNYKDWATNDDVEEHYVGASILYELKTIAYGKGSSSERLEEIKEKLSSK